MRRRWRYWGRWKCLPSRSWFGRVRVWAQWQRRPRRSMPRPSNLQGLRYHDDDVDGPILQCSYSLLGVGRRADGSPAHAIAAAKLLLFGKSTLLPTLRPLPRLATLYQLLAEEVAPSVLARLATRLL